MITSPISPVFAGWVQDKSEGATITLSNGGATISAPPGDFASLYYPVVCYPGDTVNFSCSMFISAPSGGISIQEDSPGSGVGASLSVTSANNLERHEISHTVNLNSQGAKIVYFKVGYATAESGSMTVQDPMIQINSALGTSRVVGIANLIVNDGSVTINDKWSNAGIENAEIVGDDIVITMSKEVLPTAALSYQTKVLPHFTVQKAFGGSLGIEPMANAYDQYTRKLTVIYYDTSTKTKVSASTLTGERLIFKAELI